MTQTLNSQTASSVVLPQELRAEDAVLQGTVAVLSGGPLNDLFLLGRDIIGAVPGATSAFVDGGTGFDTIRTNANLTDTLFQNIEQTQILLTNGLIVDADQIPNLGVITTFDGTGRVGGANLDLVDGNGRSVDFSNLLLEDQFFLRVSGTGLGTGDAITVDFSGGTFNGNAYVIYTGGNQDDSVRGGSGDDSLIGGNGNDTLNGGAGDDTLDAGPGLNVVSGGVGDDVIRSLEVSTGVLDGGADTDLILVTAAFQNSIIDGGFGFDTLRTNANLSGTSFEGIEITQVLLSNAFTVDADQVSNLGVITIFDSLGQTGGANLVLADGNGQSADFSNLLLQDQFFLRVSATGLGTGDAISVDFSGGTFNGDSYVLYTGGNQDDSVRGGSGDDVINGANGNDTIDGGAGNDTLTSVRGDNMIFGGAGEDFIRQLESGVGLLDGGADNDTVVGSIGNDTLIGGTGDDSLIGGAGHDSMAGGSGNDTLEGGIGDDTLEGGTGLDVAVFSAAYNDYQIVETADGFAITQITGGGANGTDTLESIEFAQFSDGIVRLIDAEITTTTRIFPDGRILVTTFVDGVRTVAAMTDPSDVFDWDEITTTFDDDGGRNSLVRTLDDGRVSETTFLDGVRSEIVMSDPMNAVTWDRIVITFDENGDRSNLVRTLDDGRLVETSYAGGVPTQTLMSDPNNAVPWDDIVITFDENGERQTIVRTLDDGRVIETQYADGLPTQTLMSDPNNAVPWDEIVITFDETGARSSFVRSLDTGFVVETTYADGVRQQVTTTDMADVVEWMSRTDRFDLSGVRTERETVYDDGSVEVVSFLADTLL